jgi:hypothetical protein
MLEDEEVFQSLMPGASAPDDGRFHGDQSMQYYSSRETHRRALYRVHQHLPLGWYITVAISCSRFDFSAGDHLTGVHYNVFMRRRGDGETTVPKPSVIYKIPELLSALRAYDLPSYDISRACLPPEVNMYRAYAIPGGSVCKPLTDSGDIWWAFNSIRAALDNIAAVQAAAVSPPPAGLAAKPLSRKAKKAAKKAALAASIRDLTAQLNAM